VIWTNLGNLAAGTTTNLTLTVNSTASGAVTNIASGGSSTLDSNPTNNVTPPGGNRHHKSHAVITWPVPANVVYGTALGSNQNDATLTVPGTPAYTPTNGTVLPAGTNTLQVIFNADGHELCAGELECAAGGGAGAAESDGGQSSARLQSDHPPLTYSLTGFVNGETTNVVSGTPLLGTTATNLSPAGVIRSR